MDDFSQLSGPAADAARELGVRSSVGVPISVEGRLWGVMIVSSTSEQPLPADTGAWLAGFTELVGTAIANAQARMELRSYAEEQAALRRVATLVAGGAPPEEVFAAVAAEAGRLLGADLTAVGPLRAGRRGDDTRRVEQHRRRHVLPYGPPDEPRRTEHVHAGLRDRRPVRMDDYGRATGAAADAAREWGFRTAVGAPITVEGRLWGVMSVGSTCEEPLPADTEARLAGFTELVGTAIANAQARVELRALRRGAGRAAAGRDAGRRRRRRRRRCSPRSPRRSGGWSRPTSRA